MYTFAKALYQRKQFRTVYTLAPLQSMVVLNNSKQELPKHVLSCTMSISVNKLYIYMYHVLYTLDQ